MNIKELAALLREHNIQSITLSAHPDVPALRVMKMPRGGCRTAKFIDNTSDGEIGELLGLIIPPSDAEIAVAKAEQQAGEMPAEWPGEYD